METEDDFTHDHTNAAGTVATAVALGMLIGLTILGNLLVLVTIWTQRNLRTVESNYLLFSLALADLFVGLLVMPLGAVQIVTGEWLLGATWCEIWTFVDITCCSSSILHLLSVALDRYLSVSLVRLKWSVKRNTQSIYVMIGCAWVIAGSVAACPLLGWKDGGFLERIAQKVCIVSQSLSFLFFGITVTFYLPLVFILLFYWRIWAAVRTRHRNRKRKGKHQTPAKEESSNVSNRSNLASSSSNAATQTTSENDSDGDNEVAGNSSEVVENCVENQEKNKETLKRRNSLDSKRFQRATKTLAIITGAFVLCWSPRFLMLPIVVLCGESCPVDPRWADFTQWLGFSNSVLNPILYTIFSSDFRNAFRNTLQKLNFKI